MKRPKILISFLFIGLLAKGQTDSAIWKNDAKYTGNHTLTMNGFTQFMSGGTLNADTLKTKQLTVTDGSKTSVYGKNFMGTSSADDVQLFAGGTSYWGLQRPTTSYDAAFVSHTKGTGATDSCDFMLTTRPVSLGFPVAMITPWQNNKPLALDLVPSGYTSYLSNGRSWLDLCIEPLYSGQNVVSTLRLQADSPWVDIGTAAFGGSFMPNFGLIRGPGTRWMTYDGSSVSWIIPNMIINENANAYNRVSLANSTAGTSSGAAITVGEAASSSDIELYRLAASHSSSGIFDAGSAGLYTPGGTTTSLNMISGGSIPIRIATNSTERARFVGSTGNFLVGTTTDNSAFVQIAANTSTNAQIFLNGSAADPTSPTNGMLWYNTTAHALNFRDNGVTTNLLANTSGIFLPAITNSSNATSITSDSAVWLRDGNSVSVDGHFTVTPVSGSVNTILNISVPVNSLLSGGHAAWGSGMTSQTVNGGIGVIINSGGSPNQVSLTFYPTGQTVSLQVYYHYQYRVQ